MQNLCDHLIELYQKTLRLKTCFLQNIIVDHWIKLVIKFVLKKQVLYFKNDDKLDIYYILKIIHPDILKNQVFSLNAPKWVGNIRCK